MFCGGRRVLFFCPAHHLQAAAEASTLSKHSHSFRNSLIISEKCLGFLCATERNSLPPHRCTDPRMEPSVSAVSLHLPPLLATCLNIGDCPPMLTGTIAKPHAFSPPRLDTAASDSASHGDAGDADIASVTIIDHVERDFWGLSLSGHIIALPPSSHDLGPRPDCGSLETFTAVPHGPCIWRGYPPPPP